MGEEKSEKTELVGAKGNKRKHDPTFKGPIENRSCTDVICCVIFTLYMVGMVITGIVGYAEGDPKRLLYPTDSDGKVCGIDIKDKPYLHFFDLTKCITKGASDPLSYVKQGFSCPTPQVCVKKCPSENNLGQAMAWDKMVCVAGTTVTKDTTLKQKTSLVDAGKCAPYYLESKDVFLRCMPSQMTDSVIDALGLTNSKKENVTGAAVQLGESAVKVLLNLHNLAMQILDELVTVWYWLLIMFVISMVICLLYIVLTRWATFPLVIGTFLGVLALLGYSIYYVFFERYKPMNDANESVDIVWRMSMGLDDFTRSKNTWLTLGIILSVMFAVLLLIMIFLVSRLRVACAVICEASKALMSMLSTLFFPLLPWLLQLVWFAWGIGVALFLASNGVKEYHYDGNYTLGNTSITDGAICNPDTHDSATAGGVMCLFARYTENKYLLYLQIFHLFGYLWMMCWIVAFAECALAGAFASWYFARNKPQDIPAFPVFKSMWRTLSYHTGSLAFGSAIVATIKLIRVMLEYLDRKLKEYTDNPVASFIVKCCKCCFWCLEKCIKFLNKNAYIMIAIYGKGFCSSAKEAAQLLLRSALRTVAINGVTGFILFLGKLLITGIVAVASFYFFHRDHISMLDQKLQYSAVPIVLSTLGAYVVCMLFFNVYDMGIDTIFLSFLEDEERNDGSVEKPYFMAKSLRKILDVDNKKAEASVEEVVLDEK